MLSSPMPSSAGHFPSNPLNLNNLHLNNPWAPQQQQQQQQQQHHHGHPQQQLQHMHSSTSQAPLTSSQQPLPKPSPLSSADNAPRSTHLNAVQAVHTYYSTSSSSAYTHANNSSTTTNTTNSNSTSTSSLGTYSSPQQQQQQHPKLRRMPGGVNLAEYRQQPTPPAAGPPAPQSRHARARTSSLSIPNPSSSNKMSVNGATSPQSARAMSSINAIAAGPGPAPASADGAGQGRAGFDGPRSPPNTSHVPCKFFRQGACQAGAACPFSHDLGAASETVCKYFAKGNCKFGPKCANIHILPTGHRVQYGKNGVTISQGLNFGNRVNPMAYGHSSNSALTNSFMRAEAVPPYTSYANATDDRYGQGVARQGSLDNGVPTIDTQYSGPTSPYGSPRGGDEARMGFGLSPVSAAKGLSVLDAPLPASFDSNGISHAARYGPWPASVPNKFGIESPTPSLSNAKDSRTSETLKMLHTSAFGSSEHLSPSQLGGDADALMGASPPQHPIGEEFFPRRQMHSSSTRYAKPRLLSSSAPKVDRDWDDNFLFLEEDYVPSELASELLTPAEKARRGSMRVAADTTEQPASGSGENSAKYGSPIGAASPSRWGPLFQRQQEEGGSGALGKSLKGASAFGHVGSPLRNSSLASGIDMIGNGGQNGSHSHRPSLAGSRTASGSTPTGVDGLSALTQQIQRTRLGDDGPTSLGSSPHLHPSALRQQSKLERHVSSGSMGGSTSRFTTPIDEEDSSFVFSMEEDEEAGKKRSGAGGGAAFGSLTGGGSGWSYATVAQKAGGRKGVGAVESR